MLEEVVLGRIRGGYRGHRAVTQHTIWTNARRHYILLPGRSTKYAAWRRFAHFLESFDPMREHQLVVVKNRNIVPSRCRESIIERCRTITSIALKHPHLVPHGLRQV